MQRETGKEEKSELIQWWWKTFKIGGVLHIFLHTKPPLCSIMLPEPLHVQYYDHEEGQVSWKGLASSLQMLRSISRSYDAHGPAALDLLPNSNVKWFCVTFLVLRTWSLFLDRVRYEAFTGKGILTSHTDYFLRPIMKLC